MSVGVSVTTRTTSSGKPRYVVRFRLGGRGYPVEEAGGSRGIVTPSRGET